MERPSETVRVLRENDPDDHFIQIRLEAEPSIPELVSALKDNPHIAGIGFGLALVTQDAVELKGLFGIIKTRENLDYVALECYFNDDIDEDVERDAFRFPNGFMTHFLDAICHSKSVQRPIFSTSL